MPVSCGHLPLEARESAKIGFYRSQDLPSATAPLEEKIRVLQAESGSMPVILPVYVTGAVKVGLAIGCVVM